MDTIKLTRNDIAQQIVTRIAHVLPDLQKQIKDSQGKIGHCVVDNLLAEDLAHELYAAFPKQSEMVFNSTMRERKYIAAQMDRYQPILEEALFAFQHPDVVGIIEKVFAMPALAADANLYAGGISLMDHGCYLNPHIDNSHDKDRRRWRALNLLYYVSPQWQTEHGGNLELWPNGIKGIKSTEHPSQITITSAFNRLVIMATHSTSWHSVSPIVHAGKRCCISNYYFSDTPVDNTARFHVTQFRARPGQPLTDICLRADARIRSTIRMIKKDGVRKLTHLYKKAD